MRIGVYLGAKPTDGGLFEYSKLLVEALIKLKERNEISTIILVTSNTHFDEYHQKVDRLYFVRISGLYSYLFVIKSLLNIDCAKIASVKQLEKLDICIYPAQDIVTGAIDAHSSMGVVHDLMHIYEHSFREASSFFRKIVRNFRFKSIYKNSDNMLVESILGKEQFSQVYKVDNHKIKILSYSASFRFAALKKQSHETNLKSERLEMNQFYFYPARFWKHKNHIIILDMVKMLKERGIDVRVAFAGSIDKNAESIKLRARELKIEDRVKFLGRISEEQLVSWYKSCRALIYPSFFGPSNLPPIESIFLGRKPVVANVYSAESVYGENAIYFDPTKPNELSEIIAKIEEQWPRGYVEPVNSGLFSPEVFSANLLKIMKECIDACPTDE